MFQQGDFVNSADMTPEELRRKRERLAGAQPRYGRARYVGEGFGHLASGIAQGLAGRKLDKQEREAREQAGDIFSRILGGASGNPDTSPFGVSRGQTAGNFNPAVKEDPAAAMGLDMGRLSPKQRDTADVPFVPVDPNADDMTWGALASGAGGLDMGREAASDPRAAIRQGLIERGLPEHVADGFIMNFTDESNLDPGINERNPIVPGSRGGFGLAQWTGPRRKELEAFAAERGAPVDDLNTQLDFLMTELEGPERAAAQAILSTQNAGDAGAAIVNKFLRPAEEHRARRVAEYTGGTGAPQGGTRVAQAGNIRNDAGPSQADLMAVLSNPWMTPQQRAVAQTMLTQQMQRNDPMRQLQMQKAQLELEQMQNPPANNKYIKGLGLVDMNTGDVVSDFGGQAAAIGEADEEGDTVRSSDILDDGTVIQSTDGGVKVYAPNGELLSGQQAAEAVSKAREFTVENQRSIFQGRREGTNIADAETGGAAAAAASIGGKQGDFVKSAFEGADAVAGSIGNINTAISALDAGARSGAIDRYIPNITEASATLQNSMDRMGLDVIGSVTFGALSEAELRLAMETAVPRNLNEEELKSWLTKKRDSQQKVRVALIEQARFLSDPNNSLKDWADQLGVKEPQSGGQVGSQPEGGQGDVSDDDLLQMYGG